MKLLLDTHIWVWSQLDPGRLSGRITRTLDNSSNEVWVSPVSIWEIITLCEKGRLKLRLGASAWISLALSKVALKEATLTHEVASALSDVTLPHNDPADRFLAATAKVYGLTLVTGDQNLLQGSGYSVLANR